MAMTPTPTPDLITAAEAELAAVEALRKERDLAAAQNDRLWAANHNLVAEQDALIAELDASEAARKLAEERLREAKLAFENVDAQVEDEGEFTERSWEQLRATLKEIDNG